MNNLILRLRVARPIVAVLALASMLAVGAVQTPVSAAESVEVVDFSAYTPGTPVADIAEPGLTFSTTGLAYVRTANLLDFRIVTGDSTLSILMDEPASATSFTLHAFGLCARPANTVEFRLAGVVVDATSVGVCTTQPVSTSMLADEVTITGFAGGNIDGAFLGDLTITRTVDDCAPGFFSATGGVPCTPAPAGTFVATAGATEATLCSPGFFAAATASVACDAAPVGSDVDLAGAASAIECPPNHTTSTTASTSMDDCFPIDADGDGVPDIHDVCAGTVLPDEPTKHLKKNRYRATIDGFSSTNGTVVASLEDTGGCSASQIIAEAGLGKGHSKFGISKGELAAWIAAQS